MLYTALIVIHIVLAIGLIAVVLVQRGPGATMGAAFGAGASGTVFGAKGSASFLGKLTGWVGVAFFVISLSMAILLARAGSSISAADDLGVAERLLDQPALVIPEDAGFQAEQGTDQETFLAPPEEGAQEAQSSEAGSAEAEVVDEPEPEPNPEGPGSP